MTMQSENSGKKNSQFILATDLDGTLIPLQNHSENKTALQVLEQKLTENKVQLVFVTGRHIESVLNVAKEVSLPTPEWIICDVGTSIFEREGEEFLPCSEYAAHLQSIIDEYPIEKLKEGLSQFSELRLQEEEKQGRFKLSFYVDQNVLDRVVSQIEDFVATQNAPYRVIGSVDPFNGDGLVDLLPSEVSKAFALEWWVNFTGHNRESILFSGDSGNDLAAFQAGYKTIVVANADRKIANAVSDFHAANNWTDRLCLAKQTATSGVLEGCHYFGIFDS